MSDAGSLAIFIIFLSGVMIVLRYLMGRKRVSLKKITWKTAVVMPLMLTWILFLSNLDKKVEHFIVLILAGYVLISHLYSYLSCRQTLCDTLVYLLAIEPLLLSMIISQSNTMISRFLVLLSTCFSIAGLWRVYQLPFKNYDFFDETLKLCAQKCSPGAYSSKPVVVPLNVKKHFTTFSKGALLIVKNGRMALKLSKKKHASLGKPNLMELAKELSKELYKWLVHDDSKREVVFQ